MDRERERLSKLLGEWELKCQSAEEKLEQKSQSSDQEKVLL